MGLGVVRRLWPVPSQLPGDYQICLQYTLAFKPNLWLHVYPLPCTLSFSPRGLSPLADFTCPCLHKVCCVLGWVPVLAQCFLIWFLRPAGLFWLSLSSPCHFWFLWIALDTTHDNGPKAPRSYPPNGVPPPLDLLQPQEEKDTVSTLRHWQGPVTWDTSSTSPLFLHICTVDAPFCHLFNQ